VTLSSESKWKGEMHDLRILVEEVSIGHEATLACRSLHLDPGELQAGLS
jgi:hypothetical protein